jgi:hypothetical protein
MSALYTQTADVLLLLVVVVEGSQLVITSSWRKKVF